MGIYTWQTVEPHSTNMETMDDFLENHLEEVFDEDTELIYLGGTYAEIKLKDGALYSLDASGDGDFNNHKVEFKLLT